MRVVLEGLDSSHPQSIIMLNGQRAPFGGMFAHCGSIWAGGLTPHNKNRPRAPLISPHKPKIDRRRQITWHRQWAACAKHHSTPNSIGGVQETASCTVSRQKQNRSNEGRQLISTPITDHTGNQYLSNSKTRYRQNDWRRWILRRGTLSLDSRNP